MNIWWIIGAGVAGVVLVLVLFTFCSGKDADTNRWDALIRMHEAENSTWKYDYTETTTSGSPVENNK